MAIQRVLINLDDVYHQVQGKSLVSDYNDPEDANEIVRLKAKLMTTYKDDLVSMVPSCSCGELTSNHNLGRLCHCGTTCQLTFSTFEPEVFMAPLIDGVKYINPVFLAILEGAINSKVSIVRWIGDRRYNPPLGKQEALINSLGAIPGFERNYLWLTKNLSTLIKFLIVSPVIKSKVGKAAKLQSVLQVYYMYEDRIFSNYLPLVNRRMFILVKTNGLGSYGNNGIGQTFDSALLYLKAENSSNEAFKLNSIMKILHQSTSLYVTLASEFFGEKTGIYEKHLHGARLPFSSRTVIISLDRKHDASEVHLSWGVGVTKFRPHLLNKLLKRGWKYKDASSLLFNNVNVYHPLLSELLDELIAECPLKGIPMGHQRNPTLEQGSLLLLYITAFKKDPGDKTTSNSILLAAIFAGDYDGDEMNNFLPLDRKLWKMLRSFEPHHSVMGHSKPFGVHGRVTLTAPGIALFSNAVYHNNKE